MYRDPVYPSSPHGLHEIDARLGGTLVPVFPKLVNREGIGDEFQAVEMVRMRVGEDQVVKGYDLFCPEHRGHNVSSYVEAIIVKPTPVDQHPLSPGKLYQDTVPLSHVDKGNPYPLIEVGPHIPIGYVPCNGAEQEDRDGHESFHPPHVGYIEDEKVT